MKVFKIIHIIANITAFGMLGAFLVYLLINYNSLPEPLGVHFSATNGQFDVFDAKFFAFYPFVVGFAILGLLSILTLAFNKIRKLGLSVTEKGDKTIRCASVLLIDLIKLAWAIFFSYWTYCVVHQIGMGDGTPLDVFRIFFLLLPFIAVIVFIEIKEKYKIQITENVQAGDTIPVMSKAFRTGHVICNIAAFSALGVLFLRFLLAYDKLPERIGGHFGSDGNFDVYSYKVFGFYPFVAGGGLLLIFSLLTIAAKKIKSTGLNVDEKGRILIRQTLIEVLDLLKLIWSLFFSIWADCVIKQYGMDLTIRDILLTAFLLIFPVTAVAIFVISKKHKQRIPEK
jgi:hypothetical protein